jgi:beta-glucanase (GH16 family)
MNWMNSKLWMVCALLSMAMGCSDCGNEPDPEPGELRFVADRSVLENPFNSTLTFEVRLMSATTQEVTVDFETVPGSATAGEDFEMTSGTLVFAPGDLKKEITVPIVVDESLESDEQFTVVLSNPTNAFLTGNQQIATGTIVNDDTQLNIVLPEGGYDTPHSPDNPPAGMTLAWSDEFDEESIDSGNWIHEVGGGGWGNQEAQSYTANESNSFLQGDHLFIVALEDGDSYTSARLKSQDLQEFTHGRIDVRAILPFGQALWPAIWMLGGNFTDSGVGWPRCGEIDIMELKGQSPNTVHGTAHWGKILNGGHPASSSIVFSQFPTTFADEFHVFSLEWTETQMVWLLNGVVFKTFDTTETLNHPPYNEASDGMFFGNNPFNEPFFFILNVAVGGTFVGGYPDDTTVFPQYMAVDYVRVYQ